MAGLITDRAWAREWRRWALGPLFAQVLFLGLSIGTGYSAPEVAQTQTDQLFFQASAVPHDDDLVPSTVPAGTQSAEAAQTVKPAAGDNQPVGAAAVSNDAPVPTAEKVHEAVFAWTEDHPGEPLPAIVQASGDTAALVAAVENLGGTVERELGIIQALDIRIPANRVGLLAADASVAWISLDAPVVVADHDGTVEPHDAAATPTPEPSPEATPQPSSEPTPEPVPPTPPPFVDTANLASAYPFAVNAPSVWNAGTPRTGSGVGVAVIDTGISNAGNPDFADGSGAARVVAEVAINASTANTDDGFGHGTHVAGIIGGDGDQLGGRYIGIAPKANLIDIKIADDTGAASLADAIAGIEWAVTNKDAYNIRVLNLSLHSSVAQSYKRDPLDAAVEFAWLRGVVVVVSSGNMGTAANAVSFAPANDPFVIVVGATDDNATADRADDTIATFSSRGITQDGFSKPDVVAPGRKIISTINPQSVLAQTYPDRFVDGAYFRMSGTSMSSPVVAGVVALMIEENPALTPGQIKHMLTSTSQTMTSGDRAALADGATFFTGTSGNSDDGLTPGRSLRMNFAAKIAAVAHVLGSTDPLTGLPNAEVQAALVGLCLRTDSYSPADATCTVPPGTTLENVNWEAIKWNSIKWNMIKWDMIKWDSIKWSVIKWDMIKWDSIKWSVIKWGVVDWNVIKWDVLKWDMIKWDMIKWDALTAEDVGLTGVGFDNTAFDSTTFDSVAFDSVAEE